MAENLHFVRRLAFKGFALAKNSTQRTTGHRWSAAINVTGFPLPPRKKAAVSEDFHEKKFKLD